MITLLGMIFGGLLRLAPEILKAWNKKMDQAHEILMLDKQMDRDRLMANLEIAKLDKQSQIVLDKGGLDALMEGIRAQGRPTGNKYIDFINATIRPFLTYWWLFMYTCVKLSLIYLLVSGGQGWADAMLSAWTEFDAATLGGIINFWFLDRVIKHRNHIG
jgi:hypothetical protein